MKKDALTTISKEHAVATINKLWIALGEAKTFDEKKKVQDISGAFLAICKAAHIGRDFQNEVAEIQLRSGRDAGACLWQMERNQGKRTDITLCDTAQSSEYAEALDRTGTSRRDAKRWQDFSKAKDLFDQRLAEGIEKGCELTTEGLLRAIKSGKWHPMLSSGEDNWWTPKKYIDAIHKVMDGIDLDPASCAEANKTVKAKKFYDRKTNGLDKPWEGRIFLNPPYGAAGPEFIEKFIHDYGSTFHEGIILVNSRATDADWFQALFNGILCFTDHRIDFDSPDQKLTSSTHGSCFVYFGPHEKKFAGAFEQFGNIVRRWPDDDK